MVMKLRGADIEDTIQVLVGASTVGVPLAFTEEAWNVGETLPIFNMALVVLLSVGFCLLYAYSGIYERNVYDKKRIFLARALLVYGISMVMVAVVLLAINRLPVLDEPWVALHRVVLITFPACMGAVIVDGFDKE